MTTTEHAFDPRIHPDGNWITRMFDAVERQDVEGTVAFLHPQVRFRSGNRPVVHGIEELAEGQRRLYGSIRGLRHRLLGIWREGNVVTVEAEITYTRLDGREVIIPELSLLRLTGPEQVGDYRVFADLTPVFAATSGSEQVQPHVAAGDDPRALDGDAESLGQPRDAVRGEELR